MIKTAGFSNPAVSGVDLRPLAPEIAGSNPTRV